MCHVNISRLHSWHGLVSPTHLKDYSGTILELTKRINVLSLWNPEAPMCLDTIFTICYLFKVAIKIIDLTCIKEEYARRNLHREPRVMAKLRHPCIAALYETMMVRFWTKLIAFDKEPKSELNFNFLVQTKYWGRQRMGFMLTSSVFIKAPKYIPTYSI